jgi:predicted RNA-binding protein YlxR (DUF448 family)
LRWVLGEDQRPRPDIEQQSPGRGAWLHPVPECWRRAPRGLGRALRTREPGSAAELGASLTDAANRRFATLLARARRGRMLRSGEAEAEQAFQRGAAKLLVVATDAPELLGRPWVREAVARGSAVAWGRTADLPGEILGRTAPVLAVLDEGVAVALSRLPALAGLPAEAPRRTP